MEDIQPTRWDIENAEYVPMLEDDYQTFRSHCRAANTSAAAVVVLDCRKLEGVAAEIMRKTDSIVERMRWFDGNLVSFEHPINKKLIVAGEDFASRKKVCDYYLDKTRIDDFVFRNQGYPQIARAILNSLYTALPRSTYNPLLQRILTDYPIRPYRMCADKEARGGEVSIDITRD
jgi:hypothetical protein